MEITISVDDGDHKFVICKTVARTGTGRPAEKPAETLLSAYRDA